MSWMLLFGLTVALGLAFFAALSRRAELARMEQRIVERERAVRQGSAKTQLSHPLVDLSRCLGCGTCVAACPESGVLELVHGQAMVVNGARCVGHSACERECPVGAITITIANQAERKDIPVITESLEAVGSPGLFLAGEVTAHALIKTAIEHGTAVAAEVARRVAQSPESTDNMLDLCVVGAGPAGLACSLESKRQNLRFVTLEQEAGPGGTVAKYPRQKLVLTQPVELPLHGMLGGGRGRTSFAKEELVTLWQQIAVEHELPIQGNEMFRGVEPGANGGYVVHTASGTYAARHVCIALGRRGTPQKLGIPGEELSKVAYSLLDARSYQGRRILVIGGGDSAVEAAMGLAEQPGNTVTLSYRRESFFRIKARNEHRLAQCVAQRKLHVLHRSEVRAIHARHVEIAIESDAGTTTATLDNDDVFVLAGGVAPFELLERSGVSFDPALRAPPAPLVERGTGLVPALAIALALSLTALGFALWHFDYYTLPRDARPMDAKHELLRPGRGLGLALGFVAVALIAMNLLYLVRRSPSGRFKLGSLQAWMTSHVATGILALLCATLHAAMAPRDTVGGHALAALAFLLVTGAIGRYFYAWVPRATNGRELEIEEVKRKLDALAEHWDRGQGRYVERVQAEIATLVRARQWQSSFFGRVAAMWSGERELKSLLDRLSFEGARAGLPDERVRETLHLARKAYRTALAAAHFEDLRGVLATWRYAHRWVAALMLLLLVLHVAYVLSYGALTREGVSP